MSDRDRQPPDEGEETRPRVKVTDRRRVRPESEGTPVEGPAASAETAPGEEKSSFEPPKPAEEDEAEAARHRANEYLDHLQRLKAEFDNYRKRVLKEQTRAVEMASEPLLRRLLEVLDEFDLALMAAEQKPDFEKFLHGVELVYAKLLEILRSEGLERIDAQAKPFDPTLHEALMQTGEPEGEAFVADVLRQGYTLKGRVLRPAGVKVARK